MNAAQTITLTAHAKAEWARCAQALYKAGRNADAHKLAAASALPEGTAIELARYDAIASTYRAWLCFGLESAPRPIMYHTEPEGGRSLVSEMMHGHVDMEPR